MKYIAIPQDIQLRDALTKEVITGQIPPHTFKDFLIATLLLDPRWQTLGIAGLKASNKIEAAFLEATGGVFALEDADWEKLKGICEVPNPQSGQWGVFSTNAMRQLYPYMDAILSASDKALRAVPEATAAQ